MEEVTLVIARIIVVGFLLIGSGWILACPIRDNIVSKRRKH